MTIRIVAAALTTTAAGRPPAPQGWQHVIDRAHAFYRSLGIAWIS